MWTSFWISPSSIRETGMPVHLATILAILKPVRSAPTAALQPVHEAAAREGNRSGGLPQPVEPVENQEACAGPAAILRSLAGGGGALLGASGVPLVSCEEFEGKPGTDPAGRYPSSSRHYRHVSYAGSFDFLADIPEPACIAYRSILGYREPLAGQLASRSDLMGYWQSCLGHLFRLLHAPQLSGVDAATQDARVRVVTVLVRIRFLFGIADTLLGWEGDDQQPTPMWAEVFAYLQQVRRLELHNQDFSPTDQLQLLAHRLACSGPAVGRGGAGSFLHRRPAGPGSLSGGSPRRHLRLQDYQLARRGGSGVGVRQPGGLASASRCAI